MKKEITRHLKVPQKSVSDFRSWMALNRIREAARKTGADKFSMAQIEQEICAVRAIRRK